MICRPKKFWLTLALVILAMVNEFGLATYGEAGTRILNLPTDRVVLRLYLVDADRKRKEVNRPVGRITVPPTQTVEAVLSCAAWTDLSFLEKLPPNAFDSLDIGNSLPNSLRLMDKQPVVIKYHPLMCIKGLTQLHKLTLWGLWINDDELANLRGLHDLTLLDLHDFRHRVTGNGLAVLKVMPHLKTLRLRNTAIDDDSLSNLQGLKNLQKLDLGLTNISGTGLKYLQNLRSLSKLDLTSAANIRGPGLELLANLPTLHELDLGNTYYSDACPIDDAGTVYIGQLHQLKSLNLTRTKITDKGLQNLSQLKNLETLMLGGTGIGNDSIAVIKLLFPHLKTLAIQRTRITAAAFPELRQLAGLQELYIGGAYGLSPGELDSFKQALPHCQLHCQNNFWQQLDSLLKSRMNPESN